MENQTDKYIGLMSGTSLDGVDAVLIEMQGKQFIRASHHAYTPYSDLIKKRILSLQDKQTDELHLSHLLAQDLSQLYAQTVLTLLEETQLHPQDIRAIGCHGQTIRHQPSMHYSIQIADYSLLAELTKVDVIGDFRSRDLAAGGQGAPLVPAFHQALFFNPQEKRILLNIGGIANVSILHEHESLGFDTGTGNMLMDAWVKKHWQQDYDRDALLAKQGQVLDNLLQELLSHPYFSQPIPKSTGRDLFSLAWLTHYLNGSENPHDVLRTLLEFSAITITDAVKNHAPSHQAIYSCGGGAYNPLLLQRISELLPNFHLKTTDDLQFDPQWMEAAAFAWLAACWCLKIPSNIPSATGAKGYRILGAGYYA